MALNKAIMLNNSGVQTSYWRITEYKVNYEFKMAYCKISGYLASDTREEGYGPLNYLEFEFNKENFPFSDIEEPISERNIFYNLIKQNPLFEGAEDV